MTSVTPSAPALPGAPRNDPARTARDFEGVFLGQVCKVMLESVETSPEFGGGAGEEMFRGVLAETLGAEMARDRGIGLAPAVMDQIVRLQGGQG